MTDVGHQRLPIAVADIGSNTVKASVFACDDDGQISEIASGADTVRIGYRVGETGVMDAARIERLLDTLTRFEAVGRTHGAERFEAVATQAFRVASNASEVVQQIHQSTGWNVRVITADEETELTHAGAKPWIDPGDASVIADIGGASTEIIVVDQQGLITSSGSVPIGSGALFDQEIAASPPPPGSMERARDVALSKLTESALLTDTVDTLLLPGGTGHFLGLLLQSIEPGRVLAPHELPVLKTWLSSQPAEATMARIPVQLDRAHVLPASLAIVEALVLRSRPQRVRAIPSGIRRALVQPICAAH